MTMSSDETISITLAPDTLRAVRASVEAGEYASVDALLDASRAGAAAPAPREFRAAG